MASNQAEPTLNADSTTLVTFRLQAPPSTNSVDLLGSWDGFTRAYRMSRDSSLGSGHWRGCHSFAGIICDGDTTQIKGGRDGGLKMGGTYWYYYQLDGDEEYHNPAEQSTTSCPLLPGQEVNVLEVPIQMKVSEDGRRSSTTSTDFVQYTLNPNDKYLTPNPPGPLIPQRPVSWVSFGGSSHESIETEPTSAQASNTPSATPLAYPIFKQTLRLPTAQSQLSHNTHLISLSEPTSTRNSLRARFDEFRRVRSTGDLSELIPDVGVLINTSSRSLQSSSELCHPTPLWRAAWQRPLTSESESGFATREELLGSDDVPRCQLQEYSRFDRPQYTDIYKHELKSCMLPDTQSSALSQDNKPFISTHEDDDDIKRLCDHLKTAALSDVTPFHYSNVGDLVGEQSKGTGMFNDYPETSRQLPKVGSLLPNSEDAVNWNSQRASSVLASHRDSSVFSPTLTSSTAFTGYMSPFHLSQPNSPSAVEFEDYLWQKNKDGELPENMAKAVNHIDRQSQVAHPLGDGFTGYNLRDEDYASALTLQNLPAGTLRSSEKKKNEEQRSRKDLVEFWNDGSQHRKTGLQDLFDDLGYLGGMIV